MERSVTVPALTKEPWREPVACPAMADDVTDHDVLLEIYSQLVTIKRLLIALLVVVMLFGTTALFEASRDRSATKADAVVECLLAGRQNC